MEYFFKLLTALISAKFPSDLLEPLGLFSCVYMLFMAQSEAWTTARASTFGAPCVAVTTCFYAELNRVSGSSALSLRARSLNFSI